LVGEFDSKKKIKITSVTIGETLTKDEDSRVMED